MGQLESKFVLCLIFFVVAMGGLEWGGENKIPAESKSDVFGSLTQRPEQMGTAF